MPEATYQTANWALTAIAGVLTLGRYLLRGLYGGRFHADDAVHLVAFLLLVIHGATNQVTSEAKNQLAIDEQKSSHTSDEALLAQYHHVYQLNTANNVLLYLVFWVVKLVFLAFYRMLFGTSQRFIKAWTVIFIFTVLTYFVPFGGVIATCYGETTLAGYKQCNSADQARAIKLEYSCAFNVATDLLIMALPLWMIHSLHMKAKQKFGLAGLFSIALFCVALDILRVVEALASNQNLYTVLEINMVVIISCLPTYGALLTMHEHYRSRKASYTSDPSSKQRSNHTDSRLRGNMPISTTKSFTVDSWAPAPSDSVHELMEKERVAPVSAWTQRSPSGDAAFPATRPSRGALSPGEPPAAPRYK